MEQVDKGFQPDIFVPSHPRGLLGSLLHNHGVPHCY